MNLTKTSSFDKVRFDQTLNEVDCFLLRPDSIHVVSVL